MDRHSNEQGYKKGNYKQFNKAIIEIKPSPIFGGVGVFVLRDLEKYTIIGDVKYMEEDIFYRWEDVRMLDDESQKKIIDFCIQTEKGVYAPRDINYISIPWHMNHSCDGNVGFDLEGNFIAIKYIEKGTELCFDYGLGMTDPKYRLVCKCGAKNCRKIVTGNDWKNPDFIERNRKYITPEMRKLI